MNAKFIHKNRYSSSMLFAKQFVCFVLRLCTYDSTLGRNDEDEQQQEEEGKHVMNVARQYTLNEPERKVTDIKQCRMFYLRIFSEP